MTTLTTSRKPPFRATVPLSNIMESSSSVMNGVDEELESCWTSEYSGSNIAPTTEDTTSGGRRPIHNKKNSPHEDDDDEDLPQQLVRKDKHLVRSARVSVLLVLLGAATVSTLLLYMEMTKAERNAFSKDFDGLATNVVECLKNHLSRKLWSATTIAGSVMSVLNATPSSTSHLNVNIPMWEAITLEGQQEVRSNLIAWTPIVRAVEERQIFEDFAVRVAAETNDTIAPSIFRVEYGQALSEETFNAPWLPMWQVSATQNNADPVMWNQLSDPVRSRAFQNLEQSRSTVISETFLREGDYYEKYGGLEDQASAVIYAPVFREREIVGVVTAELVWNELSSSAAFPTKSEHLTVVVENSFGQKDTFCVDSTYQGLVYVGQGDLHDKRFDRMVRASEFEDFDQMVEKMTLGDLHEDYNQRSCRYRFLVYASPDLENLYISDAPINSALILAAIFGFALLVFVLYDLIVVRRQQKVLEAANKATALVSSLFPKEVRQRLYKRSDIHSPRRQKNTLRKSDSNQRMNNFFSESKIDVEVEVEDDTSNSDAPIAQHVDCATIMFLDLVGFTSWSSERQPKDVFFLLEALYNSFDQIAIKLGAFKIETIGDCYVAAGGLPRPNEDHAIIMARFAHECMKTMSRLTKELAASLGPSTAELRARCGLHSGPVTAGVLSGDKARFQLFGDTVNSASRMESTGLPGRIQASKETVDLLFAAGKGGWVVPREGLVNIKGKGTQQTFWIMPRKRASHWSQASSSSTGVMSDEDQIAVLREDPQVAIAACRISQSMRLINRNVEILYSFLENIASSRATACGRHPARRPDITLLVHLSASQLKSVIEPDDSDSRHSLSMESSGMVLDEWVDVIDMPSFEETALARRRRSAASAPYNNMDPKVKEELREFVTRISSLYRDDVPFHSFQRSTHVSVAAAKLMRQIVHPGVVHRSTGDDENSLDTTAHMQRQKQVAGYSLAMAHRVHDMTYGVSSDPLTQFALVFAALIHDVDHTGHTNEQLVEMQTPAAVAYRNRCVAQQNALDVAWAVLMDEKSFANLRASIFQNEKEKKRFKQIVVNAVLATDVADKELLEMRKRRWEVAFTSMSTPPEAASTNLRCDDVEAEEDGAIKDTTSSEDSVPTTTMTSSSSSSSSSSFLSPWERNRRATVVIESILQACDVVHCTQHWLTYCKWNERLFEEQYRAWIAGHARNDPSLDFYKQELAFLQDIVIPHAIQLHETGVLGESYQEHVENAKENLKQWELKGEEIVEELNTLCKQKYHTSKSSSSSSSSSCGDNETETMKN